MEGKMSTLNGIFKCLFNFEILPHSVPKGKGNLNLSDEHFDFGLVQIFSYIGNQIKKTFLPSG
jgi:hypothetical protein